MKFLLLIILFGITQPLLAAVQDDAWVGAKQAYVNHDPELLAHYGSLLQKDPLYFYVKYWQLRLNWNALTNAEVMAFVGSNKSSVLSQRLLGLWLEKLGKSENYTAFRKDYVKLINPDNQLFCDDLNARLQKDETGVLEEARKLWLSPNPRPSSCLPVFITLISNNNYSLVWDRLRLVLDADDVSLASFIVDHFLEGEDQKSMNHLGEVNQNPIKFLKDAHYNLSLKPDRELVRFAIFRAYKIDPDEAVAQWRKLQFGFHRADRESIWAGMGMRAALNHDERAVRYFSHAGLALTYEEMAWKTRSALSAGDWALVRDSINAMPTDMARLPEWQYWLAKSENELGNKRHAHDILMNISHGQGYFALLASEDLGKKINWPHESYQPTRKDIAKIAKRTGFRIVVSLMDKGMPEEANAQWFYAIRDLDDRSLIAASAFANEHHWYDLAINTALQSHLLHNYALEFPIPFRQIISNFSDSRHLNEAFVLGLMRQESRFSPDAVSHTGAMGLMQLMPETSHWIDQKSGDDLVRGENSVISRNIGQGTWYLEYVLQRCNNLLALGAAAYNAGPERVFSWLPKSEMDGEVWVETIPFAETRDYVEKVLANATYYSMGLGLTKPSLKGWLAPVPPALSLLNAGDKAVSR